MENRNLIKTLNMFTNLSKMRQIWQKINKSKHFRPLQKIRDTLMGGGEGGQQSVTKTFLAF